MELSASQLLSINNALVDVGEESVTVHCLELEGRLKERGLSLIDFGYFGDPGHAALNLLSDLPFCEPTKKNKYIFTVRAQTWQEMMGGMDDRTTFDVVGEMTSHYDLAPAAWNELVGTIDSLAGDSRWSYPAANQFEYKRRHIATVWHRLVREGAICRPGAKGSYFEAFNLGLADQANQDLFVVVRKNGDGWDKPVVCRLGETGEGKLMAARLKDIPRSPRWFKDVSHVVMDPSGQLAVDMRSILSNDICLLPPVYLESVLGDGHEDALEGYRNYVGFGRGEEWGVAFVKRAMADKPLVEKLKADIYAAAEKAMRRQRHDMRYAIPAYFPESDSTAFLLPLDFLEDTYDDLALMVQVTDDKSQLVGSRLLGLKDAYVSASVVGTPSGWLGIDAVERTLAFDEFR